MFFGQFWPKVGAAKVWVLFAWGVGGFKSYLIELHLNTTCMWQRQRAGLRPSFTHAQVGLWWGEKEKLIVGREENTHNDTLFSYCPFTQVMRGVRWAAKPGSHSKRHWSAKICKILSMSSWQVNKNSQNLAWTTLYLYTQVPIDQKSQDSKSWKTRLDKIVRVRPRTTCQGLGCWRSRRSISRSANSQGGDKMFLVNRGSQKVTNTMLLEPWCPGSFNISQHPLWPEKNVFGR